MVTNKYALQSDMLEPEDQTKGNSDILPMKMQESIRFGEDTQHRKNLVRWMMWVVSVWLIGVMTATLLNGIVFRLDYRVLCVLLTTTTVNILGLSKIILSGMFGNRFCSKPYSHGK